MLVNKTQPAFFAIQFKTNEKEQLLNEIKNVFPGPNLTWYPLQKIHLTLCYCPQLPNTITNQQFDFITNFKIITTKLAAYEANSQLVLETKTTQSLLLLRKQIISKLKIENVAFDQKQFKPHISLAFPNKELKLTKSMPIAQQLTIEKILMLKANNPGLLRYVAII